MEDWGGQVIGREGKGVVTFDLRAVLYFGLKEENPTN